MPKSQRYKTIDSIIKNKNIKTPAYLDGSDASKVIYALGLSNKPKVVSDAQLDKMQGADLYRAVYETGSMPPPSTADVLDQIRNGDYTQLSGRGGSVHGRALYFARGDFDAAASYGRYENNPMVMRAKINPNAKIVSEQNIGNQMRNDAAFMKLHKDKGVDAVALYALSHGIDGWYSGNYTMIVNRGILTTSSQNKSVYKMGKRGKPLKSKNAYTWSDAAKV